MKDTDFVAFLQWALPRLRLRWPGFRKVRRQVRKRLARRLAALGLGNLDAYRDRLARDPAEWRVLDGLCRITISRFYRDKGVFDALGEAVLPELAQDAAAERPVRCWSAGCASGEEAYTLKILWDLDVARDGPDRRLEVIGTDTEEVVLDRARQACYAAGSLHDVPAHWPAQAFEIEDRLHCVRATHRVGVSFARQDIRSEAPVGPFDLVLCRNLAFTYFAPDLQAEVLARIAAGLAPRGLLVIGAHERLPEGHGFEPHAACPYAFRRTVRIDKNQ